MQNNKKNLTKSSFRYVGTRGFTLIELLVVVLIIGILSAIALPQYQRAVDKARVATILPLMRSWLDALAMYKMEHGSYVNVAEERRAPWANELGAAWPTDWECFDERKIECENDKWDCFANEEGNGEVHCHSKWKGDEEVFTISMTQPDDPYYPAGKKLCLNNETVCKALGGKEIEGYEGYYEF